ncbi:MAG: hypothetical protein A4E57_01990 [Syntrophorhabdaceae bacterium PtaU1.Bin034]|nr:MAG: hypothetical protein A4E57_01990 [Syntrophorhabdaceae bacterium PtaU1.Bin034]
MVAGDGPSPKTEVSFPPTSAAIFQRLVSFIA